jgi:hypothetical protein
LFYFFGALFSSSFIALMLFKFYKIYASLTTIITILFACIQSFAAPNAINEYERSPGTEQLLIERLFNKYNKKLRPPGTVNVEFALNLNQIVTLNQKDQIIVLNAFIDHAWTDPRLVWGLFVFKLAKYKIIIFFIGSRESVAQL